MNKDTPQQYFSIPRVYEAWRISLENIKDVAAWCTGRVQGHTVVFSKIRHRGVLLTPGSKDNKHYAQVGDYVLKVSSGFVRLSEEEFDRNYRLGSQRIKV